MDPLTHLEYALFQLTPTRTRCDLLLFSGKNKEKLASGLVEPFISHLKFFKDQISKGGYSITLRPPTTSAFWFTKYTFQRLVRFINSPEVLERFIRLEREISQIENSVHNNDSEEHAGEAGSLSSDGSTKSVQKIEKSKINAGEAGDDVQEENSKIQLQRLLETRKAMLRKEQAMAYHRAHVAGFETENMNDLILFADHFGASRLRAACIEFQDLCKKKHNDGLWMDELAAMAAYPPSELAYNGTSGLLIATESNASILNNDLNFEPEGDKNNTDQAPSTPSNVPMHMQWPNQIPQYMYNFPGPQGPRYPYPYPGMPPYYPAHMSWPANGDDSSHGRHHRSSSKKKSKSPLPDSSEEDEDDSNEDGESDSVSDSGTVSKHEKSTKKSKKKSSKTVVIRNINYITSNRKNSDGGSDDSAEDEVDGVLESLVKHHSKSSKSHEKKKKGTEMDDESGKQNVNWDAFQNLLLKDDVQDDHFAIRNDAMDVGSENYVKGRSKARANDSFVVPDRNGLDDSRKVNPHDFENGETFRMKGRDYSDADLVNSHRYGEGTNGMTNYRDLGSDSSMIRNRRDGDWFVVKNSESQTGRSTFNDDYVSVKGDVFSSETNKKNVPIDDSFMVQPQTTVPYDSQWGPTDVSMVESVNKPDANDSSQAKTGFHEPDDLYLMVSRDSGTEPQVRSSWTPEIDYGTEVLFTKSEPKPAPVETKDQTEESPVKAKTKKVAKPRPLSRSLPTDKRLPFVSRSVVHKSKREQEDEIRKRVEELAAERQRRIAERSAASGATSGSTKKPINQKAVSSPLKKTNPKVTGKFPAKLMEYLKKSGFSGVLQCYYDKIDQHLVTSLVERWRPETYTFHFPFGEATVTLEDVQMLWGLPLGDEKGRDPSGSSKGKLGTSKNLSRNRTRSRSSKKARETKNAVVQKPHGSDDSDRMNELRKKIMSFRELVDLPPYMGSSTVTELVNHTVKELQKLHPDVVHCISASDSEGTMHKAINELCASIKCLGKHWMHNDEWMARSKKDDGANGDLDKHALALLDDIIKVAQEKMYNKMDTNNDKEMKDNVDSSSNSNGKSSPMSYPDKVLSPPTVLPKLSAKACS
ncbi:hypothetical protein SSX86_027411 [Deinandra increscens subsp. villosa]|uniref:Aminotransferase-like plant mobile domain-containing protein n=1 Tax=Deinandra increscens subsp. villosa TaxID=3103831 RepID=A0AAP0CGP8_9ASTR